MKNYIEMYSTPAQIRKFQDGGQMAPPAGGPGAGAPPEGAPAGAPAQGGGDIESMIAEYAQTRDPQLAVAICDMIVEMMAQGQGGQGGQSGQGGASPDQGQGGAPAGAPMGKKGMKFKNKGPVFKKGNGKPNPFAQKDDKKAC